jgi:hypothetical protein
MGESLGMGTSTELRNTAAGVRVRPCPRLQLPLKHGYPYYSSCPAATLFPACGLFLEQRVRRRCQDSGGLVTVFWSITRVRKYGQMRCDVMPWKVKIQRRCAVNNGEPITMMTFKVT